MEQCCVLLNKVTWCGIVPTGIAVPQTPLLGQLSQFGDLTRWYWLWATAFANLVSFSEEAKVLGAALLSTPRSEPPSKAEMQNSMPSARYSLPFTL